MKKTYIAPKSTDYKMEAIAPIATSDSLKMEDNLPMSEPVDNLDNQFTKNNNAWDDKW